MDPQYYKFKSLCKDIDNKVIIYNKAYWEIFSNREKGNTMHDEKGEFFFNQKINKKIYFDFKKSESINVLQKNKFTLTEVTFEDYYVVFIIQHTYLIFIMIMVYFWEVMRVLDSILDIIKDCIVKILDKKLER